MSVLARSLVLAMAALFVAGLLAADPKGPGVPDSDYPKQLSQSVDVIREALKGEVGRRQADRAASMAVLIAVYAQQNLLGEDAAQRATVRDAALQVVQKIGKKDYAAARKQAQTLTTLKADPKAKKERVALPPEGVTYKELMQQYRAESFGGLGHEDLLTEMGASPGNDVPAKKLTAQALHSAYHSAAMAEVVAAHVPKMKADEWKRSCEAMRAHALDLAAAIKAKDGKAAFKAVNELNRACDKCHQTFRRD